MVDASELSSEEMRAIAAHHGHESAFVTAALSEGFDYTFRFYVPRHEMEMCGHATIGALWLLAAQGVLKGPHVRIDTRSGPVSGFVDLVSRDNPSVEITQPAGRVFDLSRDGEAEVLRTLGLARADPLDLPIQNAITSRVKTLIPMRLVERLNALDMNTALIEACCTRIGSTGLYPYAIESRDKRTFEARQFPKSSGYPEDAATGIAATALSFGLLRNALIDANDAPIRSAARPNDGRLSEIRVRLGFSGGRAIGCLLGGTVGRA